MWKKIAIGIALLVGGGVVIDNPASTQTKIHNTGAIVTSLTDEAGNVVNEGVASLQQGVGGIGAGTGTTETTLAPEAGTGRG